MKYPFVLPFHCPVPDDLRRAVRHSLQHERAVRNDRQRVYQGNKSSGHIAYCRACGDRKVKNVVYWLH